MENPFRETVPDLSVPDGPIPDGLEIIETLGWHPDEWMRHPALHIARMGRTADRFGFRFDPDIAASLLRAVASLKPLRCRMALGIGGLTLTTSVLPPNPALWRVGIAAQRLTAADPWLQHKTTNRAFYDQSRAQLPEGQDEWLFLNERGEVCEGTISNIFVTLSDGTCATPPLTSGLLPGILRQTLLDQYPERIVTLADLRQARSIHMGNALRGLIPVEITGFETTGLT